MNWHRYARQPETPRRSGSMEKTLVATSWLLSRGMFVALVILIFAAING